MLRKCSRWNNRTHGGDVFCADLSPALAIADAPAHISPGWLGVLVNIHGALNAVLRIIVEPAGTARFLRSESGEAEFGDAGRVAKPAAAC